MFVFEHINNEFVCKTNNKIIAWLEYTFINNYTIKINTIFVNKQFRKNKIASILLKNCLELYKNYNFFLETYPFRDAPMSANKLKEFYFKFNFKEDSFNKNLLYKNVKN